MTAKRIGSQFREPLNKSGYKLIKKKGSLVLLQDTSNDRFELWQKNDHFAGYVIEIDGVGYEFISGREPTQFDDPRHQIFGIKTVRGRREFITAEDIKKKQRGKG